MFRELKWIKNRERFSDWYTEQYGCLKYKRSCFLLQNEEVSSIILGGLNLSLTEIKHYFDDGGVKCVTSQLKTLTNSQGLIYVCIYMYVSICMIYVCMFECVGVLVFYLFFRNFSARVGPKHENLGFSSGSLNNLHLQLLETYFHTILY